MSQRAIVIRTSVAAFLACVGIVSAFAARDVLAWRGQTAHADVAIASFSPDLSVWRPHTWLPAGASEWLVGAGDDVAFGQALQHFQVFRGHQQWGLFVAGGVNDQPNVFARRTLELAQLAANHFVAGLGVAADVDLADVDAASRVDEERE